MCLFLMNESCQQVEDRNESHVRRFRFLSAAKLVTGRKEQHMAAKLGFHV